MCTSELQVTIVVAYASTLGVSAISDCMQPLLVNWLEIENWGKLEIVNSKGMRIVTPEGNQHQ